MTRSPGSLELERRMRASTVRKRSGRRQLLRPGEGARLELLLQATDHVAPRRRIQLGDWAQLDPTRVVRAYARGLRIGNDQTVRLLPRNVLERLAGSSR